jgi:hypothetical protein
MSAELIREDAEQLVIQFTVSKSESFQECEELIQKALNEAGGLATQRCLEDFDTDGSPIIIAGQKFTAKRTKVPKNYETPYCRRTVERFVYQNSHGGQVYIPMEAHARIIAGTTPRFAKIVSYMYSKNNSTTVQSFLRQGFKRKVSRCYIQDISAAVASHVEDKSRYWDYAESEPAAHDVASISIGIDGTCLLFCEEGHRQAMVETVAFFDASGERLHTNYVAAAPEHGKATFLRRMDEEITRIKSKYKDARYVGISDGATDYLPWLKRHHHQDSRFLPCCGIYPCRCTGNIPP